MKSQVMWRTIAVVGLTLAGAAHASAQVVQSIQFGTGLFMPTGRADRARGDVLVADLENDMPLSFRIPSFKALQLQGEYVLGFGHHVELGFGTGFQTRTVGSKYATFDLGGNPIMQDLHVRTIPALAIARFLPVGRPGHVQPYVGVGGGILRWRYTESGQFIDANQNVFATSYVGSGTSPVWLVVGGVRLPVNGDIFAVSLEARYQSAIGKNLPLDQFLSDRIDLSGTAFNIQFMIRY